jgi:secreted PhoX family phosphatase
VAALTIQNPALAPHFADQGEILIKTRLAADKLGATAMDRPEDIQASPVTGKVYMVMTSNLSRTSIHPDPASAIANPRVPNRTGHILEIREKDDDHSKTAFTWNHFLLCGDPSLGLLTQESQIVPGLAPEKTFFAGFRHADKLGKIAAPDNIAFDNLGNLWIATDGQPSAADIGRPNDAIHAVPTEGHGRGHLRQFLSGPKEAELCGPEFSDDQKTLFAAIQHPGEGGGIPNTISTWPERTAYAKPAVVAVRHNSRRRIGSA